MLALASSWLRCLSRNQQLTATVNTAPMIHEEVTVWQNLSTANGEKATALKLVISKRIVSGLNCWPMGYCIQLLATRIHHAEMVAPRPESQVEARWNPFDTFFQPKNMTATNVLSMKKASMPSMARGAPKTSPTIQE